MKLSAIQFGNNTGPIHRIDSSLENFLEWDLEPLDGNVLEEQYGFFLIPALLITSKNERLPCYLDITMPERIFDYVYTQNAGRIIQRYLHEGSPAEAIPGIAIAGFGDYNLFYSHLDPDAGLEVLWKGLKTVKSAPIAEVLGYILRDENRLPEALTAFSQAVEIGASSYFVHIEHALLLDALGQKEEADRAWSHVETLAGKDTVESCRLLR